MNTLPHTEHSDRKSRGAIARETGTKLKISIAIWFLAAVLIQLLHRSIPDNATIGLFLVSTVAMLSAVYQARKYRRLREEANRTAPGTVKPDMD